MELTTTQGTYEYLDNAIYFIDIKAAEPTQDICAYLDSHDLELLNQGDEELFAEIIAAHEDN